MTAFQLKPVSGSTYRLSAAVTLALGGALVACRDAGPTTAPEGGAPSLAVSTHGPATPSLCANCVPQDRILYVREFLGGEFIHRMNSNGTGDITLGQGFAPAWSPAKTKIAFVHKGDIWVMNHDGTGLDQITHTPTWAEFDPAWSPDGKYIAYTSNQNYADNHDAPQDVWTMKADGSDPVKLTWASNLDELRPTWSPDGTKIALMSRNVKNGGQFAIWIMTIDPVTRNGLLLSSFTTAATGWAASPVWSPDGTRIAFNSATQGCGIAIQSIGSQIPQPFAPAGVAKCKGPAWSPNGLKLAFRVVTSGDNGAIATSSIDGTGLTYLTSGNTIDYTPAWHRK